jgi:hypothetical protein
MKRIERWLPRVVVSLVLIARLTSLFEAEAPSSKSSFESWVWLATLPGSALTLLVEARGQDSMAWWSTSTLLWAIVAYLQFRAIAVLPRALSTRPVANRVLTVVASTGLLVAALWAISRVPSHPEEEPVSFFLGMPLVFFVAFALMLVLSIAVRTRGHRA